MSRSPSQSERRWALKVGDLLYKVNAPSEPDTIVTFKVVHVEPDRSFMTIEDENNNRFTIDTIRRWSSLTLDFTPRESVERYLRWLGSKTKKARYLVYHHRSMLKSLRIQNNAAKELLRYTK